MSKLNPYNFVRFEEMAADARQTPVWHSATDPELLSGQLTCTITALSPIFIPHIDTVKVDSKGHKTFSEFFHLGDGCPVIPGSTLKGMFRSVAEAAANGCLSVFSGKYKTSNQIKKESEKYEKPYDLTPAIEDYHLQPCTKVVRTQTSDSGLCPTCRIFGMPSAEDEESQDQAGQRPNFFAGKVTFNDANLVDETPQYENKITLVELSSPDPTSYLYYSDYQGRIPKGRKFYYHHDSVKDDRNKGKRQSTVRPLKPETAFEFTVDFHNLTKEELELLVFALELEAKRKDGQWHPGAYHKMGYAKPAGLGSIAVQITQWRRMELHDAKSRYKGKKGGWRVVKDASLRKRVRRYKRKFLKRHGNKRYWQDLQAILWYPSPHKHIEYPKFPHEFDADQGYQLPAPGKEPGRRRDSR